MEHKLYLNGRFLKTMEFPNDRSSVHCIFYTGDYKMRLVGDFSLEKDYIVVIFCRYSWSEQGHYGTVDEKTEKKIRDNIKGKEIALATKIFAANNEGWCDGYDVGFDAAKKTILKKISEITFADTGE